MKLQACLIAALIAATAFIGCSDDSADDLSDNESSEGGISDSSDDGKADSLSRTATVFTLRHDDRRCRFPICGGWWVSRVNFPRTKCADGSWASECYVGALNWDAANLDSASISDAESGFASQRVVVRGRYGRGSAGEFGGYDTLKIKEAYRAIGTGAASGLYYFLGDNGIRCITTPCFSTNQDKANSTRSRKLSDLDVSGVDARESDLAQAFEQMGTSRILATGFSQNVGARGVAMVATQILVRIEKQEADPLACSSNDQCGTTPFPVKVESAADCYCPTCPVPMAESASAANAASWQQFCAASHGFDRCLPRPCAAPPTVGCDAGQCSNHLRLKSFIG
jgi:hypothetical protein